MNHPLPNEDNKPLKPTLSENPTDLHAPKSILMSAPSPQLSPEKATAAEPQFDDSVKFKKIEGIFRVIH